MCQPEDPPGGDPIVAQACIHAQRQPACSAINLQEICKQVSDAGGQEPPKLASLCGRCPSVGQGRSAGDPSRTRQGGENRTLPGSVKVCPTAGCPDTGPVRPESSTSFSLPVVDGAYAAVPVWSSARAWLALVRRVLSSRRGERARRQAKLAPDTLMRVARDDARSADWRTGRGVSTSHETVARRLGMSSRTVGTARRLLERLGLSVTMVRGRHLSPAERSLARSVHGRYQQAAASVRALTVPAAARMPVESFHLPRSGSVGKETHLPAGSPTRAHTRETAATRPKQKKKRSTRSPRAPRPLELQRFAWRIAHRFLLTDVSLPRPGRPIRPGILRGSRHIGQLCRILERHQVTPDRYTVQSLADALEALIRAGKIRAPRHDELRDPLAHFAWTLKRLEQLTEGTETFLERVRRETAQQVEARRAVLVDQDSAAGPLSDTDEAMTAAAKLFTDVRTHRRPTPTRTRRDVTAIVHAVIGPDRPLYDTPAATQVLVGSLTQLHNALTDSGWSYSPTPMPLRWTHADGGELVLRIDSDQGKTTVIRTPNTPLSPKAAQALDSMQAVMHA